MAASPEAVTCARHPQQQTFLRCGKCGDPICPRCLVYTPVGVRCPNCVTYMKNPVSHVDTLTLVRAAGSGVGAALAGGVAWALISSFIFMGYISLALGIGVGYLVGLAVSRSTNRKRAPSLQLIAGSSTALGFLVAFLLANQISPSLWYALQNPVGLFAAVLAVIFAVSAVR